MGEEHLRYILLPEVPPLRILIVDDEASLRMTVRAGLEQLGYSVEEAATGLEGLNKLSVQAFDVLILDLKMPGMQGLEVMQHLSELYPQLKVIILTGRPTLESAIEAVNQGAVAYLRKPCSLHEIAALVNDIRAQRRRDLHRQALLEAIREAGEALRRLDEATHVTAGAEAALSGRFVRLGAFILDRERQVLFCPSAEAESLAVALTAHETTLLTQLMRTPDTPHSCTALARALGYLNLEEEEAQAIVRPHISRLRRKLAQNGHTTLRIHSVRGKGYLIAT